VPTVSPAGDLRSEVISTGGGILVAELEDPAGPAPVLHLVRIDGREQLRVALPRGSQVAGSGGDRIVVVEPGGALRGVRRDGFVEDLGTAAADVVLSPDGARWIWSQQSEAGPAAESVVYQAGIGAGARIIARAREPGRVLRPFAWTPAGALVAHETQGAAAPGASAAATGPVDRLDPVSGITAPVDYDATVCGLMDVARDGTIACLDLAGRPPARLALIHRGRFYAAELPGTTFQQLGPAIFRQDGIRAELVAGGTSGDSQRPELSTAFVNPADGAVRRIVGGVRTAPGWWAWLPDGTVLVSGAGTPDGSVPAGTFRLNQGGRLDRFTSLTNPVGRLS
jgi:hypothetical protein